MKIRHGYVSNSSSSSFLIGVAKVKDRDKVEELIKDTYGAQILSIKDYLSGKSEFWGLEMNGNSLTLESFDSTQVTVKDLSSLDEVLIYETSGGDESDFWNEEYEEHDYDIDLDHFPENVQKIFMSIQQGADGLEPGQAAFGAGRDG